MILHEIGLLPTQTVLGHRIVPIRNDFIKFKNVYPLSGGQGVKWRDRIEPFRNDFFHSHTDTHTHSELGEGGLMIKKKYFY
jgi:hypothetical protein